MEEKMKVLVTGGAGFIGSHIVDALVDKYEVVVMDNLSSGRMGFVNPKAKFYNCDVSNETHVKEAFDIEKGFDYIFHLAAQVSVPDSVDDPVNDAQINLLGLLNILQQTRKYKPKKVIFSSSGGAIYGEADKIPTPEDYPIKSISPYGIAKYTSENYLYFFERQFGINYTVLRYANIYGPRQGVSKESGVISIFVKNFVKGKTSTIFGDGSAVRDYVYVKDVVKANLLAINKGSKKRVNIATKVPTTTKELFYKLKEKFNVDFEPIYSDERPGDIHTSLLDNSKAKEVLRWTPDYTLDKGLDETVEYFQSLR
jgi:UDP-glucose 4-epimerase